MSSLALPQSTTEGTSMPVLRVGLALPPNPKPPTANYDLIPPSESMQVATNSATRQPFQSVLALPWGSETRTAKYEDAVASKSVEAPPPIGRDTTLPSAEQASTPENETPSPKASSKKRKRQRTWALRCRHGCKQTLVDKGTMRAHHRSTSKCMKSNVTRADIDQSEKIHNCFPPGKAYAQCGICKKKFATNAEYERHRNRDSMCMGPTPEAWNVAPPETRQERADTWGYEKDGDVSEHLIVWLDEEGQPLEWKELPSTKRQAFNAAEFSGQLQHATSTPSGSSVDDAVVIDDDDDDDDDDDVELELTVSKRSRHETIVLE